MVLTLTREAPVEDAVVGVVSIDGAPWCYSLERQDVIIPVGKYRLVFTASGRVQRGTLWSPQPPFLPELLSVPGRSAIRIHAGNSIDDTEGCILVGLSRTGTEIHESRKALTHLMEMVRSEIEHCTIDIQDAA